MWKLGSFARTCNPSKWEADIWGWLEVRRSAMIHFNERQRPHWACRQYGHTGGTRGWLGVERWQLCLRDTSRSANCHRRAAVGHWISLCVKCSRMVDSAKMANLSLSRPILSDHLSIKSPTGHPKGHPWCKSQIMMIPIKFGNINSTSLESRSWLWNFFFFFLQQGTAVHPI